MKYLLLLCADETTPLVDISDECVAWTAGLGDGFVTTVGLHPPNSATTVRVRDGDVLFTDGPFAETKEQMGGLTVIECSSAAEAREIAATHPWARYGMIEIRQILT
ncbi:YciI family protein [Actinophytocola sp.]|uniref:YciI family protein n=1 Tax=Actinophytocola sp. TaxID=1872138 RepID=UPI002ED1F1DB